MGRFQEIETSSSHSYSLGEDSYVPYSVEKVGQPNFVTLRGTDGIISATVLDHNVAA